MYLDRSCSRRRRLFIVLSSTQFDVFTCYVDVSTGAAALEPRLNQIKCTNAPFHAKLLI